MALPADCPQNTDQLQLVREGTSQGERLSGALDPGSAPVNERTPAHGIVFAQAYSSFLTYYDLNNLPGGDWNPFFSNDVSVQLAIVTLEDISHYKSNIQTHFDFLNNLENQSNEPGIKDHLGTLFSIAATLASQLDLLKEGLPADLSLKGALQNLIQTQLARPLKSLMLYHRDGVTPDPPTPPNAPFHKDIEPAFKIMGAAITLKSLKMKGLSTDWIAEDSAKTWPDYVLHLDNFLKYPSTKIYGSGATLFARANHIATHNLFQAIFDQFLKVYARTISDAKAALELTLTKWPQHEPHYALFLAFLQLFEYARAETNTLTRRHLELYYREILQIREKGSEPSHAHLLVELGKQTPAHLIAAGELFKAGKDDLGKEAFFSNDRDFAANQGKVAALKAVYRHGEEPVGILAPTDNHLGRLYASPVTDSDDGLGAELTSVDQSWHPFHNKKYQAGMLSEIQMPKAEAGFAIASHYLWMAEGTRKVTVDFTIAGIFTGLSPDRRDALVCLFTSEEGWIEKTPVKFVTELGFLRLEIELSGEDPPVTPYSVKTHGYNFATNLPVLLVKLRQDDTSKYIYPRLQKVLINQIDLKVSVDGLKTLAISNDFGPVDTSKPFQPYGASPVSGNALIIGSKEAFQKELASVSVKGAWLSAPAPFNTKPHINIDFLNKGQWVPSTNDAINLGTLDISTVLTKKLDLLVVDKADLVENEFYNTASRHGFARLVLSDSFGQSQYQAALVAYLKTKAGADPGPPPTGPLMSAISISYAASQSLILDSPDLEASKDRSARFFHLAPFGQAEQHPSLTSLKRVYLLPQFAFERDHEKSYSEGELYIGITGVRPPQNLALLFQVADGTADPLSAKPHPHIHWSYLQGNEWVPFLQNEVEDQTSELLNSGIITFAVPRGATDANTILPAGMHWIRAAVASKTDAICRLRLIAAQALEATFTDHGNDPAYPANVLAAGTINKLDQPDPAVKKIIQPFPTFGGRAAELPTAFYTRISERLRHKDRAIGLWDYERIILEAFPQIYKVKCLNHTHYEPHDQGSGIYRELAPGHVTIVTIPTQQLQNLRDPLRPYTSLGLLVEIEAFLRKRLSCFVKLHVKNPQFEEVRVNFRVRLFEGFDESLYTVKLQESITRFLSPWAFPGGGSPSFGGKVYKSVLINFVEAQPYVDYVTDFQLFHDINGIKGTSDALEVKGSKAVSVLVSVPADRHGIQVVKPGVAETAGETCPCEA